MKRGAILFIGLISVCLLSGCGMFRYFDGSSDREVKNFNVSKEELLKDVENLQSGNKALRETVDQQQAQIEKLEEKDKANLKAVSVGQSRIGSLEKEKNDLLEENQKLKTVAAATVIKEVTLVEPKTPEKAPTAVAKELRIKVLAGSGGLSAARKMSKALQVLGYKVEKSDSASTARFRSDMVYYAKDSEKEARQLAGRLGQGIVLKPLTWPSIFDIIVVAK